MKIPNNWTFKSEDVANEFDSHVREQLPWYDLATSGVVHIARHYMPENGVVYDIGASTGNIGRALKETIEARNVKFIPIEPSLEMASLYEGPGGLIVKDALSVEVESFDVAICFLSLMFFPIKSRRKFIQNLKSKMNLGGCILIVDKVENNYGYLSTVLWRLSLNGKMRNGVLPEEIIKKELSLAGIQRPLCKNMMNGFNAIEWFRYGVFSGWIIERGSGCVSEEDA